MNSGADVLTRRATVADAAELARMRAASSFERVGGTIALRDAYAHTCAAFFLRELGDPESFIRTWVATCSQRVVGGATLTIAPTLPRYGVVDGSGFDGRIRDVYVEPEFRSRGVGTALLAALLIAAKAERVDRLSLGATEIGRPLYLKAGFVSKGDEMVYVAP